MLPEYDMPVPGRHQAQQMCCFIPKIIQRSGERLLTFPAAGALSMSSSSSLSMSAEASLASLRTERVLHLPRTGFASAASCTLLLPRAPDLAAPQPRPPCKHVRLTRLPAPACRRLQSLQHSSGQVYMPSTVLSTRAYPDMMPRSVHYKIQI